MTATAASDALRADHRKIEIVLDRLLTALLHLTSARVGAVRRHFQEIRRLARPHFAQEEGIFYPAVRTSDPNLLARMDAQHEHARLMEQYLEDLLGSISDEPSERDLVELHRLGIEFHDAVQTHIVDEEEYLLVLADSVLSPGEQERLLSRMQEQESRITSEVAPN